MKKCGITNGYFGKFVGESKMAISNFFSCIIHWSCKYDLEFQAKFGLRFVYNFPRTFLSLGLVVYILLACVLNGWYMR